MTDQKQVQNGEHFKSLGSMIINYSRCTREIKFRISVAKAAFKKKSFSPANWT
jgi:hypothetical protein